MSREEGGVQSRARTVQPLLRAVGRLVIGAVTLMSALSTLGLNIAPLLASAGVVGIAVGFGAQTLVRDLFSGAPDCAAQTSLATSASAYRSPVTTSSAR